LVSLLTDLEVHQLKSRIFSYFRSSRC